AVHFASGVYRTVEIASKTYGLPSRIKIRPTWLYGECVARWIATLCAEREVWKMMSPSRSGAALALAHINSERDDRNRDFMRPCCRRRARVSSVAHGFCGLDAVRRYPHSGLTTWSSSPCTAGRA